MRHHWIIFRHSLLHWYRCACKLLFRKLEEFLFVNYVPCLRTNLRTTALTSTSVVKQTLDFLTSGILILTDNAKPHNNLDTIVWECIDHFFFLPCVEEGTGKDAFHQLYESWKLLYANSSVNRTHTLWTGRYFKLLPAARQFYWGLYRRIVK